LRIKMFVSFCSFSNYAWLIKIFLPFLLYYLAFVTHNIPYGKKFSTFTAAVLLVSKDETGG